MTTRNIYTATRLKQSAGGTIVRLAPDQAKRKMALLSRFITDRWGSGKPVLGESLDQETVEAHEAFIDPFIQADMPVPEYQAHRDTAAAPSGAKVCKACHQDKPLSEFYSHPKTKDRRQPVCKGCQKAAAGSRKLKIFSPLS